MHFCRRGSREPCGSKSRISSYESQVHYRRGSREPCGSKLPTTMPISRILKSRLARALWIEIELKDAVPSDTLVEARESLVDRNIIAPKTSSSGCSRGSREPCGSKFTSTGYVRRDAKRRGSREPCGSKFISAFKDKCVQ